MRGELAYRIQIHSYGAACHDDADRVRNAGTKRMFRRQISRVDDAKSITGIWTCDTWTFLVEANCAWTATVGAMSSRPRLQCHGQPSGRHDAELKLCVTPVENCHCARHRVAVALLGARQRLIDSVGCTFE